MSATLESLDTLVHDEPSIVGAADPPAVELAAAVATSPVRRRGAFAGVWRSTTGKLALGVLGLIVLLAIFGPLIAPYDPQLPEHPEGPRRTVGPAPAGDRLRRS